MRAEHRGRVAKVSGLGLGFRLGVRFRTPTRAGQKRWCHAPVAAAKVEQKAREKGGRAVGWSAQGALGGAAEARHKEIRKEGVGVLGAAREF